MHKHAHDEGLTAEDQEHAPAARSNERNPRTTRSGRWGGVDIGRTSFHRGDSTQKRIRLNPSLTRSKIPPIQFFRRKVPVPNYDFYCHACKKTFSKVLTIARHDKEKIACPRCGSKNVEQRWAA